MVNDPRLLLILVFPFLDRIRGGWLGSMKFGQTVIGRFFRGKWPIKLPIPSLMYGWAVAAMVGHHWDFMTALIAVGWVIGERPGWGAPIGEAMGVPDDDRSPEWYQKGPFKNPWAALWIRGMIWGLPVLLLTWYWEPIWEPMIAMSLAFPISVLVNKYWKMTGDADNEWYRGLLFGVILWVLGELSILHS